MSSQLNGKHILVITSNTGIERDELLKPLETLRGYGATVTHASSKGAQPRHLSATRKKTRPWNPTCNCRMLSAPTSMRWSSRAVQ